jgi:hypothetical protein
MTPADRTAPSDPVRARRATVAKWNTIATRLGYVLYAVAVIMFFVALATDFTSAKVTVITVAMIVGSVLLVPAIIVGYAVKAAEKEDVARGV